MLTHLPASWACVNGKIIKLDQAVIPLTNRGFLFGEYLCEVLKIKSGYLECFDLHYDRLQNGASELGLIWQDQRLLLLEIIQDLYLKAQTPAHAYLKLIYTCSEESIRPHQRKNQISSPILILCPLDESADTPNEICLMSQQIQFQILPYKSNSNAFSIRDWRLAQIQHFDDILYYNHKKQFLCTTTANIFFGKLEKSLSISTPKLDVDVRPGTRRQLLIQAAQDLHLKIEQTHINIDHISSFDLAFTTSTISEIQLIHKIDQHAFDASISKTSSLINRYQELILKNSLKL